MKGFVLSLKLKAIGLNNMQKKVVNILMGFDNMEASIFMTAFFGAIVLKIGLFVDLKRMKKELEDVREAYLKFFIRMSRFLAEIFGICCYILVLVDKKRSLFGFVEVLSFPSSQSDLSTFDSLMTQVRYSYQTSSLTPVNQSFSFSISNTLQQLFLIIL